MDPTDIKPTVPHTTLDDYYEYDSSYEDHDTSTTPSSNSFNYEDIFQKVLITLYSITFILGIIGNGLVIWIAGFRMKKTISAVWFLNLAIADFLCCASLPVRIAESILICSCLPVVVCIVSLFLFNLNMSASVLILTSMTIDRCVSVMWPFWAKVHRTRKLVGITVAIIWVFSLLLTGLMFYLYVIYFHDLTEWCTMMYDNRDDFNRAKHTIQLIRLVIMFVIPFLIILTSYMIIFLKLKNSKRPPRSQRPYRIITAVILCFFICWCPYYIWPLIPSNNGGYFHFYTVNTIVITLAYLNSCINPIIYVFMGHDFRPGFLRSIPARLERALSEHPDDLCRKQQGY